ncbi:GNAT family N-acetyltransferase [Pseudoduganella violacea]|uniref:Putative acetyltransferase n=1 Tax=Pseudoduganella violacea TaxID=1715466 RepID=A0A7W5FW23_9BURK|nr:GNAT family N-acetyltransferase [Pseudoduganella violacea]MBB3121432.1 putative acetyltransferase [Pseudoduganella violacea]
MAVRPYIETDFQAVCRIYLDAKRDELAFERGGFVITPLDRDTALQAAFKESAVLVFENEKVLGFSAAFGGQLRALFVHSSARGRGVGGALLNAVSAEAPQGLSLNVAKSNAGAIRFYEENGFAAVGEIVRQYGGRDVIYLQMRRESM